MSSHYSVGLTKQDRVNNAIGGGLPKGSLVLLEGPDGGGKSVITQRFAFGLGEEGFYTSYVSTELTAPAFIDQMYSLSYDVTDHLLEQRLLFLNADIDTHEQVGGKAHGRRELLARLREAKTMWKGDVIILDEFGAILRNDPAFDASAKHSDEDHAMQALISFFQRVMAQGKTIILTVNPETVSERALRPLRDISDIYFGISTSKVGSEVRRNIEVKRFQDMKNPVDDNIGFAVQQGRGITIESRTVA